MRCSCSPKETAAAEGEADAVANQQVIAVGKKVAAVTENEVALGVLIEA